MCSMSSIRDSTIFMSQVWKVLIPISISNHLQQKGNIRKRKRRSQRKCKCFIYMILITITECCVVAECTLRSERNYAFIKNAKIVMLKMDVRTSRYWLYSCFAFHKIHNCYRNNPWKFEVDRSILTKCRN